MYKRQVENHKVAEDIVQEIFINIWESNKQYNSINGFKAYLYEAVSNRCADCLLYTSLAADDSGISFCVLAVGE